MWHNVAVVILQSVLVLMRWYSKERTPQNLITEELMSQTTKSRHTLHTNYFDGQIFRCGPDEN